MNKFDYIFCDLDGPILDGKLRHYRCYVDTLKELGVDPIECEVYWNLKRNGIPLKQILELSNYSGDANAFRKLWIEKIELRKYLRFDVLKPDVKRTLNYFSTKTNELCLLTLRKQYDNLIWELKHFHIYSYFDKVIAGGGIDAKAKYNLIKHYHFTNALLIGDTEIDMETSKLANCKFIGIANGLRTKEIFKKEIVCNEIVDIVKGNYLR